MCWDNSYWALFFTVSAWDEEMALIGGFRRKLYNKKNGLVFITVGSGVRTLTIQSENYTEIGFTRGDCQNY